MSAVLLFGIHCHQPVGNFDFVFEKAYEKAYEPFIRAVMDAVDFRFSVHITGALLEWIKENRAEFFDALGRLVSDNRVELQVSGFYEPILAAIPSRDRIEQIEMAKEFVKKEFGAQPRGLWLTERIWDTKILKDLVACGIEYVILDDYHLVCSGLEKEEIKGYYVTEDEGKTLFLFPISEELRYLIPFRDVPEVVSFLEKREGFYTIYDDGEKFGIWPGTYSWVYKRGWLKRFLKAVDEGAVKCALFSEVLENTPPTSRVYPPIASYFEMGEWSLPAELAARFHAFVEELKASSRFYELLPFVRGGIWHNFLVKYPEANRMHKRMVWISRKFEEKKVSGSERRFLFKAQCNDAYWHGVFGGLYLPHLRRAVYSNLSRAEDAVLDSHAFFHEDVDCDGKREFLVRKPSYTLWICPHWGGQIKEFTVKDWHYNLVDVLTRRLEHYHIIAHQKERQKAEVASIHEIPRDLKELPEVDSCDRGAFIERLFFEDKRLCLGDEEFVVEDFSSSFVRLRCEKEGFEVKKSYIFEDERVSVLYTVSSSRPFMFETEININPGTPDASIIAGEKRFKASIFKEVRSLKGIIMHSPFFKGELLIKVDKPLRFFAVPIFTLSQSEKGFDEIFQETALIFKWEDSASFLELKIDVEVVHA